MIAKRVLGAAATALLLASQPVAADRFEAVHAVSFGDNATAMAAMSTLMDDPAMKGAKATLYVAEFGVKGPLHLIVEDFDSYDEYMASTAKRVASHGWSRYLLAATDSSYQGSDLVMVVDDHGAARRSAGYLAAIQINTTDPAAYRAGVAELAKAIGHPGVMRLVAMRSGDMRVSHVVLIGGPDFKAVNEFLDRMYASEAFADFAAKVGATRKVVGLHMLRKVASWGG